MIKFFLSVLLTIGVSHVVFATTEIGAPVTSVGSTHLSSPAVSKTIDVTEKAKTHPVDFAAKDAEATKKAATTTVAESANPFSSIDTSAVIAKAKTQISHVSPTEKSEVATLSNEVGITDCSEKKGDALKTCINKAFMNSNA